MTYDQGYKRKQKGNNLQQRLNNNNNTNLDIIKIKQY